MLQSTKEIIEEMGGIEKAVDSAMEYAERIRIAPRHASYEEICRVEPRIEKLRMEIPTIMGHGNFWQEWSLIKRRLSRLVGWECRNPQLASSHDWDVAFRKLFSEAEEHSR